MWGGGGYIIIIRSVDISPHFLSNVGELRSSLQSKFTSTTRKQKQRVFDTHKNMVVVGDVIVTKIIEKLVEIGFNYAADRYFAHDTRMKVELERLNDALPRIQAVVEMAESGKQEITGALKKWLCQLKDAVYEADNVVDDLDYLRLQKQAEMKAAGTKGHDHSRKR